MEIAILTICRISGHVFHENFTDFDQVFSVSDENLAPIMIGNRTF